MVPSSITTQLAPSTNGMATSMASATTGAEGQTNFDQFLIDKTSSLDTPHEVVSDPFKDIFQLLSFFLNPSSNAKFQSASSPDTSTQSSINTVSTETESNKPKANQGFLSDLQMLLTIIQNFLAGLEDEPQNSQMTSFTDGTSEEKGTATIAGESINALNSNNEIGSQNIITPAETLNENDSESSEKTVSENQDNLLSKATLPSESKDTEKVTTEKETKYEKNIKSLDIEQSSSKTDNSYIVSVKPNKENNNNNKQKISNQNNYNSLFFKDFHLKDIDMELASFEYHGGLLNNSFNGQNLSNSKQNPLSYISTSDQITTNPFFDLTGHRAVFSAITENGQDLNGELLEITGTLNGGKGQDKSIKNSEFHFRAIHLSAFEKTLNLQEVNQQKDPQDILIIDFKNFSTNEDTLDNEITNQQQANDIGANNNNILTSQLNQTTSKIETSSNHADLQEKNVISQLTLGMSEALKLNKNRAVLHLNPPDLGTVRVNITVDHNNHVHANFIADHPDTKHLLEANLQHLKDQLAQNGFNLSNVNVDIGNGFSNPNSTLMGFMASNGEQQNLPNLNTGEQVSNTSETVENNPDIKYQDDGIHIVV